VAGRFAAQGFEVFRARGNDREDFAATFASAKASTARRPRLIIAQTTIGLGVDEVAGTAAAHGSAGLKFIDGARERLGLPRERFFVSNETRSFFANKRLEWARKYDEWTANFVEWRKGNQDLAKMLDGGENVGADWATTINFPDGERMSTRVAAGNILQKIAEKNHRILSGSADLFSSAGNYVGGGGDFSAENFSGRNVHCGIREHGMAAIANGIAYDGMFRIACSTFLVFSDYMRAAIRVAALAGLGTIFIFTHDSIAVGEDGPTHQPVETLASLRCIPRLDVVRPADYGETIGAWILALANVHRPTALVLSRQDLPSLPAIGVDERCSGTQRGAYVAFREVGGLRRLLLASGSELHLAMEAAAAFEGTRVVSMPCMEAFERQSKAYKDEILPPSCVKRVAIEAGTPLPWHRYVGTEGKIIGVDDFGFSAPAARLMEHFGITVEGLQRALEELG
jgi:transketolase